MKDCRAKVKTEESGNAPRHSKEKRDLKYTTCFNCRQKGHCSSNCPQNDSSVRRGERLPQRVSGQGATKQGKVTLAMIFRWIKVAPGV